MLDNFRWFEQKGPDPACIDSPDLSDYLLHDVPVLILSFNEFFSCSQRLDLLPCVQKEHQYLSRRLGARAVASSRADISAATSASTVREGGLGGAAIGGANHTALAAAVGASAAAAPPPRSPLALLPPPITP